MNNSRSSNDKPSGKQLRYLKDLAQSRGESFTYPQTRAQASREIERLKGRAKTPSAERRREERAVRDRVAMGADKGASVRDEEVDGYGPSAHWV